jgi:hypothetical protein
MQNGDDGADAAMELSEEGEIVSESGEAPPPASPGPAVLPSSFVPPAASYADHHYDDSAFLSHRPSSSSSPLIKFPIPQIRPLVRSHLSSLILRLLIAY